MPPGVILAADPGGLGTMVLATSPVVYAGTYYPANWMDESELFPAVMTVTYFLANFSQEIADLLCQVKLGREDFVYWIYFKYFSIPCSTGDDYMINK